MQNSYYFLALKRDLSSSCILPVDRAIWNYLWFEFQPNFSSSLIGQILIWYSFSLFFFNFITQLMKRDSRNNFSWQPCFIISRHVPWFFFLLRWDILLSLLSSIVSSLQIEYILSSHSWILIMFVDSCSWWGNWFEDKSKPTTMRRTGVWTAAQNKG